MGVQAIYARLGAGKVRFSKCVGARVIEGLLGDLVDVNKIVLIISTPTRTVWYRLKRSELSYMALKINPGARAETSWAT